MAEVTRRRTGEFVKKLFEVLMTSNGAVRAQDAIVRVRQSFTLSPYEAGSYGSGGSRFEKILRFATVDCVKAGWLSKAKGQWEVTEAGRRAFGDFKDPEAFYKEACRLYAIWKAGRDTVASEVQSALASAPMADAAEALSVTLEEAEEQAWTQVETFLRTRDPFEFQRIVADLLEGMGYHVSWISPPGKDGGVDIVAHTDPLGTTGPRIKVQVKRWQSRVDLDNLRSFIATIGHADVGLYVCLGGFTKDAEDYARAQESRRITLLDADRFFELWIEFYAKLTDAARQRFPLTPIYFLSPR
ncbi:Mrr restriction system protein [Oharaeibacter diazotrophicus]|uniref:Restriction system protein n=1 Tax=Oharaeibacter diazotrophicus TaxID=1920512 RepID=A0A4R6RB48_9HYPH|nr:Mrr restriction system protein [Oharaeibacter diazotrophicus]TDP83185.1 restriction system protein [Oharaeibacter diazotrophicus]BBE72014.1 Mrr restriction system protein [Pleomorphomonas sp. SM30]GLS78779.1 hypothetical protein GCM10007904_41160 [Oharaeibacter diazotrophicus]